MTPTIAPQPALPPELHQALAVLHAGDRVAARRRLLAIWKNAHARTDSGTLCAAAHFLADLEGDPHAELAWDLLALATGTGGQAGEDRPPRTPGLSDWMPSLHLNVGDAFLRTGRPDMARRHARIGLAWVAAPATGYLATMRDALDRLLKRAST